MNTTDESNISSSVVTQDGELAAESYEARRRKLMKKIAAGAFAAPVVLSSLSANAAPGSIPV